MDKPIDIDMLMLPRVRCNGSGEYCCPGLPFKVGDILNVNSGGDGKSIGLFRDNDRNHYWINPKDYTHLFRKLSWWEERQESEMPEYVKAILGKLIGVWRVIKWDMDQHRGIIDDNSVVSLDSMTFPATQTEYDNYKNKNK